MIRIHLFLMIYLTCLVYLASAQEDVNKETNTTINCNYGTYNQWHDKCICFDKYTTHDALPDNFCNYEQKSQLTGFLLSFFLGYTGAGRFYIGQVLEPVLKLLMPIMFCCLCIPLCIPSCAKQKDGSDPDRDETKMSCCNCLFTVAVFIWWLHDVILFGLNNFNDSEGVELYSW